MVPWEERKDNMVDDVGEDLCVKVGQLVSQVGFDGVDFVDWIGVT